MAACTHDHSCEEHDCSSDWSLYKHIDLPKVSALNEAVPGSVKSVFKAWEQRLSISEGHLESNEGDPELIVFIPFTSDVKIKSISIIGGSDGTSPSKMRAFINRDGIDFSDAQTMQPVQEWELAENTEGLLEYQTRYSRFQGVGSLTLHFPDNYGGDTSEIHYIGLKGEATQLRRDVVATIVYELMPNPSDHNFETPLLQEPALECYFPSGGPGRVLKKLIQLELDDFLHLLPELNCKDSTRSTLICKTFSKILNCMPLCI
uniref:PITH domain-containing protein n=1 Tax=Daucus carota subsp. sativus TaxID=79200 RepID=A0A162B5W0_DAUCS